MSAATPAISSKTSRLSLHVLTSLGGYCIAAITGLILSPVIIRGLGDSRYGIWTLFADLIGYYNMLDIGIIGGVSHYVARYLGAGDREGVRRTLSTAMRVLSCIGLLALAVSSAIIVYFPRIFKTQGLDIAEIRIALVILSVAIAAGFPMAIFSASLIGHRKMHVVNTAEMIIRVATSCLIWVLMTNGTGIVGLAWATAAGRTASWMTIIVISKRIGLVMPSPFQFSRAHLRELASYGSKNAFLNLATMIIYRTSSMVIGVFLGVRWVTYFSIGSMLVNYASDVCSAVTRSFTPHFTHLHAAGEHAEIKRLYLLGSRLAGLFAAAAAAGLFVFGRSFIHLWQGPAYVSGSIEYRSDVVLVVLLCAYFPRLLQSISWQLLFASRNQGFLMWLSLCEAVANLALSVFLVRRMGLLGVALGMFIPLMITHVVFLPVYVLRKFEISWREYLGQGIGRPLITGSLMFLVARSLVYWRDPQSWSWFIVEVALTLVAGTVFTLALGITQSERKDLVRRLRGY
jgi:O-antigen/teichoic acid export membrane protein